MDLQEVFREFEEVKESYELRRVLEVVLGGKTYRIELLHSYSNANAPWNAHIYVEIGSKWQRFADFPCVMQRDEETALRDALDFLQEGAGRSS
jgi:hypothetical protein